MTSDPKEVPLIIECPISDAERARAREVTAHQWTLKAVLDWCLAQQPPILGADVVTQDEFTHDLIVPLPNGLFLVYDST